jgi:hypothetical protein
MREEEMQPVLTDRDIKFVMDKRGHRKEVILSYKKFTEIQNILEEILPDREYDLTEAICEGVKEIGYVKKKKACNFSISSGIDS